jgi:cation transport ATPase
VGATPAYDKALAAGTSGSGGSSTTILLAAAGVPARAPAAVAHQDRDARLPRVAGADSRERSKEELDQEWSELVEEHRLAMPGVQVLFAFLLILPFQNRFRDLTTNQEYVYFSALLCAAVAIVLLITPTAAHRIRWRQADKEALLLVATRTAIAATVFMAASVTASVYLITDYLFGEPATAIVTALIATLFAAFWYVLPLVRRLRDTRG